MKLMDWRSRKGKEKICMITCYDYTFAKILNTSPVDCILVGDSVAMVMYGHESTLHADIPMIARHVQAVKRGAPEPFLVADLPFLSYRKSLTDTMTNVGILMQAGASAVKLEGSAGNLETVAHIVESGIPVMGHLGLTPQHVHGLSGYRVQGRSPDERTQIIQDAQNLEQAGCFAIVLECIPSDLALEVTSAVRIPTIGIGAGSNVDGQVLVLQDCLGMNQGFQPKFLKHFLHGESLVGKALSSYCQEVQAHKYPEAEHQFH